MYKTWYSVSHCTIFETTRCFPCTSIIGLKIKNAKDFYLRPSDFVPVRRHRNSDGKRLKSSSIIPTLKTFQCRKMLAEKNASVLFKIITIKKELRMIRGSKFRNGHKSSYDASIWYIDDCLYRSPFLQILFFLLIFFFYSSFECFVLLSVAWFSSFHFDSELFFERDLSTIWILVEYW